MLKNSSASWHGLRQDTTTSFHQTFMLSDFSLLSSSVTRSLTQFSSLSLDFPLPYQTFFSFCKGESRVGLRLDEGNFALFSSKFVNFSHLLWLFDDILACQLTISNTFTCTIDLVDSQFRIKLK